jgi:hypothetical protein
MSKKKDLIFADLLTILISAVVLMLPLSLLAASSTQGTRVPVFEPEFTTTWSGGVIHTDNYGIAPCAVDWNGDMKKDLLIGTFYNGNIYFYPNAGTNEKPAFKDRSLLMADGQVISLTYG